MHPKSNLQSRAQHPLLHLAPFAHSSLSGTSAACSSVTSSSLITERRLRYNLRTVAAGNAASASGRMPSGGPGARRSSCRPLLVTARPTLRWSVFDRVFATCFARTSLLTSKLHVDWWIESRAARSETPMPSARRISCSIHSCDPDKPHDRWTWRKCSRTEP